MYISIYITDINNVLVFEQLLNPVAPSFNELWSKLQNLYPDISGDNNDKATCSSIFSNDKYINCRLGKNLELYRYCSNVNKLYFWCLVSGRLNSKEQLYPFVIMEELEQSLMTYFEKEELTITKLVNNYDRISLILYWLFDGGEPTVGKRYNNWIKHNIPSKYDFSKVINNTAHNIQIALQKSQKQQSNFPYQDMNFDSNVAVPWRMRNVDHVNNELYLDLVESIHVVLETKKRKSSYANSTMKIVTGNIIGKALVKSVLNGNPIVEMKIDMAGNDLESIFLHECVKSKDVDKDQEFENTKLIKFLPPDGSFKLFDYNINLNTTENTKKEFNAFNNRLGLVTASFEDGIGMKNDEFQLTLNISNSTKVQSIQNLQIEIIFLPKFQRSEEDLFNSSKNEANDDSINKEGINNLSKNNSDLGKVDYKIKMLRSSHGRFENSLSPNKCSWIFDKETNVGITPVLTGCVEYTDKNPNKKMILSHILLNYSYNGELASGMKIQSLEIQSGLKAGKGKSLFKGVKYSTTIEELKLRSRKI
ncbi:hypothetical protein TPHA_0C04130 [Tetrapisispora phaffii CBS 4417]|uniref:MHD domain-containing protein n=1 Tax=Tetrapisispora phaffii (strain ATCC 24235 / CBS 4417 / NBRC 1672 / NRRL Y-8282 / UCD 70-5) TaxID=1071381 RepID=G8BQQ1_TETPH|nr:hypothetical protein TPHA_0C04130 [Tetrapisispora phaffii CBS 4417]CCE62563.1 hypothetical protein TPHA_0C04130 [Tetrapisispora phaffii CBS 4417]